MELVDAVGLADALGVGELGDGDVGLDLGEGLVQVVLFVEGVVREEGHGVGWGLVGEGGAEEEE